MRQLYPASLDDVDVDAVYAADVRRRDDRPWLALNMITSLDGATAVAGRSGGLATPADKHVFHLLRGLADVILVAAGTARAEHYGPARPSEKTRAARRDRGQSEAPPIAVISGRLDLDLRTAFFTEATVMPIVITSEAAPKDKQAALDDVADVVVAGDDRVDLVAALQALGDRGFAFVLCEGGPSLNGQLFAADLVDELCLSLAPLIALGTADRLALSPVDDASVHDLRLDRVLEAEGMLLTRYVRATP